MAEQVDLPGRTGVEVIEVARSLIAGKTAESLAGGREQGLTLVRRGGAAPPDGGQLRTRCPGGRAGLIHPGPGCGNVQVLGQRRLDQRVQGVVMEAGPPVVEGHGRARRRSCREQVSAVVPAVERRGRRLRIRANGAGGQTGGRGQGQQQTPSGGLGSAPERDRAGRAHGQAPVECEVTNWVMCHQPSRT